MHSAISYVLYSKSYVGLILYHSLRCWPNINMDQRVKFAVMLL